jgi:hypothetical protein
MATNSTNLDNTPFLKLTRDNRLFRKALVFLLFGAPVPSAYSMARTPHG